MKKLFALLWWLLFIFSLSACEPGNTGVNSDGITTTQEDKRWGELFTLQFTEEGASNLHRAQITSENHEIYNRKYYYNCKDGRCSNSQPELSERVVDLLDEQFSGENYDLRLYTLLQIGNEDDLVLTQRWADFHFLTEVDYSSQDDKILIKDIENQLPLAIQFDKPHDFVGSYVDASDVIVIDKYSLLPRFTNIDIISPQSLVENNERLYPQSQAAQAVNSVIYEKRIYDDVGTNASLVFHGIDRSPKPQVNINLPSNNYKATRADNDLKIDFSDLQLGHDYQLELSRTEKDVDYRYKIPFTTMDSFKVIANKQLINKDTNNLGNSYAVCFSQPVDSETLDHSLKNAVGSWNFQVKNYVKYNTFTKINKNRSRCYTINFYLSPHQEHNIDLKRIESTYGETYDYPIQLSAFEIPDEDSYIKLVGETMTFLPAYGEYGQKTQIVAKNQENGKLYYRACNFLRDNPAQIINNMGSFKRENSYYSSRFLAHQFVECSETKTLPIDIQQKKYRQEQAQDVELAKLFGGQMPEIVEVGVEPFSTKRGFLYMRSNLWFVAKYSPDELHVWIQELRDGKNFWGWGYVLGYYDPVQEKFVTRKWSIKAYEAFSFPDDVEVGFLYVYNDYTAGFMLFPKNGFRVPQSIRNSNDYLYFSNPFTLDAYELGGSAWRSRINQYKTYSYTDRVLYKAGAEDIFVSGWIRKQWVSRTPKGTLTVELFDPMGDVVETWTTSSFDEFGGFKTKFSLAKDAKLWSYRIKSHFAETGGGDSYYNSYIQIQEYKKANISINSELLLENNKSILRLTPQYYFGSYLQAYDVDLSYTLRPQGNAIFDRDRCGEQRCDNPYYYNNIESHMNSSGGSLSINNYDKKYFDLDLQLPNTNLADFNIDISLVDKETEESVYKSISEKILPEYLVGIQGRTWDWYNMQDKDKYIFKGQLLKKVSSDKRDIDNYDLAKWTKDIDLFVYRKAFNDQQILGPDGELYYTNAWEYVLEKKLNIAVKNWKFEEEIAFTGWGDFFLRAVYDDNYENHQYLYVSDRKSSRNVYGHMSNNHKLNVFIKDKEYEPGEEIEVNIDPYIKGARAIVTIEKNGQILEQKNIILDGSTITLDAKKSRYPNAYVSVAQVISQELNSKISERAEPRLYIGYENMKLSPTEMGVDFDIEITNLSGNTQEYFYPGQKIALSIQSLDHEGLGLKSRMSVAIVDKALLDIYDELRTPLESFYLTANPGFFILSNYQLMFKALQVFTANGEKGGGWWGDSSVINPRKNFLDVAFRRGGEISDNDGKLYFETTLADNLTTWAIDVIAVGEEGEMGTHRSYFTVSQDVILSVNLPRFIAMHNTVRVPVSVITNKSGLNDVELIGQIQIWDHVEDIEFIWNDKRKKYFDLNIDDVAIEKILNNDEIKISVAAQNYDAVEYTIPIRKENSFVSQYEVFDGKKLNETVKLDAKAKFAHIELSVATVPISQVSDSIKYLIHYPYGCTEQLLSSMYPSLVAKDLYDKGFLEEGIISGNSINYHGNWTELDTMVAETLEKVYKNQHSNWLFGYWQGSEHTNDRLSIYVFHVMTYLKNLGYNINADVYKNLSVAVKKIDTVHDDLYFYLQMAMAGETVETRKVQEVLKDNPSLENKIMAYAIFAYNDVDDVSLQEEIGSEIINYKWSYYYSYVNKDILKAYLVRALVQNNHLDKAFPLVQEFIEEVDAQGRRWRSTQNNVQIVRAIADYMHAKMAQTTELKGTLEIAGEVFDVDLGFVGGDDKQFVNHQVFDIDLEYIDVIDFALDVDDTLLVTLDVDYIPEDIKDLKQSLNQVEYLDLNSFKLKDLSLAHIGDIIPMTARFSVEEQATELAVIYNIPSNTYIINNIGEQGSRYDCWDCYRGYYDKNDNNSKNEISFVSTQSSQEWYSCVPDHYEIRYDRLFLYYDELPADASCNIEFSLAKTHDGVSEMISQEIFEMYSPEVRGRNYTW